MLFRSPLLNCKNTPQEHTLDYANSDDSDHNNNLKKYLNDCECCEDKPVKKRKKKRLIIVG